jgi:hypothetical protein
MIDHIESIIYAFVVVYSLTLAAVAFIAFRRSESVKILFVAIAFALFVVKGLMFSIELFAVVLSHEVLWTASGLLDVGILGMIFLATIRR